MPPNVFDILDDSADANISAANNNGDSYDVFVSYAKINCPSAFTSNEIDKSNLPPSYQEAVLSNMCDPRDIVRNLKAMGTLLVFAEVIMDWCGFLLLLPLLLVMVRVQSKKLTWLGAY